MQNTDLFQLIEVRHVKRVDNSITYVTYNKLFTLFQIGQCYLL